MSERPLGQVLRDARVERGMSLREVERASGISNAHLSQLETGRIGKPDLALLWELATLYELDFEELMRLAGHPVAGAGSLTVALRAMSDLTDDERRAVVAYITDLRRRRDGDG